MAAQQKTNGKTVGIKMGTFRCFQKNSPVQILDNSVRKYIFGKRNLSFIGTKADREKRDYEKLKHGGRQVAQITCTQEEVEYFQVKILA